MTELTNMELKPWGEEASARMNNNQNQIKNASPLQGMAINAYGSPLNFGAAPLVSTFK